MERPRVLVVDPDADSRELIRKVLARRCDLLFQPGPLYTLEALELFEPDLALVELELPALSGFELLGLIQAAGHFGRVRLLVFSGLHDGESQKLAYRLGADAFLAKPCRPSQLFKAAVVFARRAVGDCAMCGADAKRLSPEEAAAQLAETERRGVTHPITAAALHAREHQHEGDAARRSILASIARRRPAV